MGMRISKLLLILAVVSLSLAIYIAFNATKDCDLSDFILIVALPGLFSTLVGAGKVVGKIKFSLRSRTWITITALLCGFVFLGLERSHLQKTAVGDCQ